MNKTFVRKEAKTRSLDFEIMMNFCFASLIVWKNNNSAGT